MDWKIYDDPIEMLEQRFQYFPRAFCWRGRRYTVQGIAASWTGSRRAWLRHRKRRYFEVKCMEGVFELFHDLAANTWHLRRARLAAPERSAVWHALPAPQPG